jgi:putative transposase
MRQLNGVYTQRFNRRHRLVGHLFQGRYKAIIVERETYLLELARYVVLHPVRAGMVADARDWPWSSYGATVGASTPPRWLETDWILGQFAHHRGRARASYVDFVRAGMGLPSVWEQLRHPLYLGSEGFVDRFRDGNSQEQDLREVPRAQRRCKARALSEYEARYVDRHEAMARAYQSGGYSMQAIADHFGVHYATVSRAVKGYHGRDHRTE